MSKARELFRMNEWNFLFKPEKWYEVNLERFEKTDLERYLDRKLGTIERTVYDDVYSTYVKYLYKYGSENVRIITDLIEPQTYKVMAYEIEIIPPFEAE